MGTTFHTLFAVLSIDLWKSPVLTGSRPPPSDGFTFTSIDAYRAIIFGGILHDRRYINDVYIINFLKMVIIILSVVLCSRILLLDSCNLMGQ